MTPRERLPPIVIPDRFTEVRDYLYPKPIGGNPQALPSRDPALHGAKLREDLAEVRERYRQLQRDRVEVGLPDDLGLLLEFTLEPGQDAALDKLDLRSAGIELLSVQERGGSLLAAVRVPDGKLAVFERKVEAYRTETTRHGKPKNSLLGAAVREIRRAVLDSLWTDRGPLPPPGTPLWWEVWLRREDGLLDQLRGLAGRLGIRLSARSLDLLDRTVVLAFGDVEQLTASVDLLDCIAELRRAKELASFFTGLVPREQGDWVQDLAQRLTPASADAPAVCLLDTGVNRSHPLLRPFLAERDLYAVDSTWGVTDHMGHGTQMAGLAALGDLTVALAGTPASPGHVLESVVLLNPVGRAQTAPDLYGAVTASAVALPEIASPARERVFCMTVTADDARDRGRPSSWSAEVDTLCHGGRDEHPRLMVISAGNLSPQDRWSKGLDENDLESIHDPGQAWNAITVGAYTEKVWFDTADYPGHRPIATAGALSPSSTTAVTWSQTWPVKPDVVLEGGNATVSPGGDVDLPEDLSLLTTHWRPQEKLLVVAGETSGAAALCARLAAHIGLRVRDRLPDRELWPETVRALLIHSARWTAGMEQTLPAGPKTRQRQVLLGRYGWGVPDLDRATLCAHNALTLVAQRSLQPFQNVAEDGQTPVVRTCDWHLHALPWPVEALQELGATEVELRVTLSYFVEPNPAQRGRRARHRYRSAGLRFAMQRSAESDEEFRGRISKAEQLEDGEPPSFKEPEWTLGRLRDRGSVHSDSWTGTAADLAARRHLAVFPVSGWWKERAQLKRYNHAMRYALVVSIHAPGVEVDLYTPVAAQIGVEVGVSAPLP